MSEIRFKRGKGKSYGWDMIEKSGDLAYDTDPNAKDGIWLWVEKPTRVFIDHSNGMFSLKFDKDAVQLQNPYLLATPNRKDKEE